MGMRYSTSAVEKAKRLSFWRDLVHDAYVPLQVRRDDDSEFFGELLLESLGRLDLSMLKSCGQVASRTPALLRHSQADFFFVLGQVSGKGRVRQDSRETELVPGAWAVIDTTRPYDLVFDRPFEQLVVSLPRSSVPDLLKASRFLTARDLSRATALGSMFANYLALLSYQVERLGIESRPLLADSILNLLAATVTDTMFARGMAGRAESLLLFQLKEFILKHLREPELCVGMLARTFRVSNRYIHKVFEAEGSTVSEYMRRLRLENCCRDLLSERNRHQSITRIAFSWGFNSAAHFSYVFRRCYGQSASEYRRQHAADSDKRMQRQMTANSVLQ